MRRSKGITGHGATMRVRYILICSVEEWNAPYNNWEGNCSNRVYRSTQLLVDNTIMNSPTGWKVA